MTWQSNISDAFKKEIKTKVHNYLFNLMDFFHSVHRKLSLLFGSLIVSNMPLAPFHFFVGVVSVVLNKCYVSTCWNKRFDFLEFHPMITNVDMWMAKAIILFQI